ncbi:MAG: TetR/AcrR family transcriptional regulator [Xanthobacteraceae bacterium]|nr:TetR/AcrR family transcriptional regulator [Xanthobacteraceae bacterium]MBV9629659.1 TetR/AcrR family transcriptional regulator [Xanthobacteraceae bacterium]
MRKDAKTRREKLIAAATEMFVEHGMGVALDLVAERAGVGRGTLYRNFVDRSAMIVAVLETLLDDLARFVEHHRDSPTLFEDFARQQGAATAFFARTLLASGDEEFEKIVASLRRRIDRLLTDVIERSVAMGVLDPSVTVNDLRIITRMLMAASNMPGIEPKQAFERALQIVRTGLAR